MFSYLEYPLLWSDDDPRLLEHSALWESRTVAGIFQQFGYQVDAVNYADQEFVPAGHYDIVFDIYVNLGRWAPGLDPQTVKLLHSTGSDPYYQNQAELKRVHAVNARRQGNYQPKRLIPDPELFYRSLQAADACSLIGNQHTLSTYPERFRDKINLVTVSSSVTGQSVKAESRFVPPRREFLWFFGGGAVHKGLDLVLEVFARHPEFTLHVVGPGDADFMDMYRSELTGMRNIRYYGQLNPSSRKFRKIISNVFCFIAPTCSEGISPAVTTCLQLGLYPLISRDTGVTLPANCGAYLETCTLEEIESAVLRVHRMSQAALVEQIRCTQADAAQRYSRQAFLEQMTRYITEVLAESGKQI